MGARGWVAGARAVEGRALTGVGDGKHKGVVRGAVGSGGGSSFSSGPRSSEQGGRLLVALDAVRPRDERPHDGLALVAACRHHLDRQREGRRHRVCRLARTAAIERRDFGDRADEARLHERRQRVRARLRRLLEPRARCERAAEDTVGDERVGEGG